MKGRDSGAVTRCLSCGCLSPQVPQGAQLRDRSTRQAGGVSHLLASADFGFTRDQSEAQQQGMGREREREREKGYHEDIQSRMEKSDF